MFYFFFCAETTMFKWLNARTRQSFLMLASLGLLSACGEAPSTDSAVAAAPQRSYEWKLITSWPKNLPALGTTPEYFADIVEEMSAGRMKIRVFGANELVGGLEVFDAVSSGVAEIGHSGAYYWQGKIAGTPFFSTIPFGLTGVEMNAWLDYGGGKELWREIYEPFNLYPTRGGNSGTQMFGWFNKEINSLEDIKGLKMRIPGLGGEVFSRAGGTPVTMQVSDVFTSMQTGALDATEFVGPYNDLAAGYHTVADYYYYPGWHEPGSTIELVFNKEKLDALPADLRAIVLNAAEVMNQKLLDEYTALNNAALQTLIDEHGVQLRKLPDDVLAEFRRLSADVVAELADTDATTRRIYESYSTFQKGVENYHAISEEAYIDARRAR
jgi:TRAP-type mannitol/chloroaromatic compound transport system substrate-binding protein